MPCWAPAWPCSHCAAARAPVVLHKLQHAVPSFVSSTTRSPVMIHCGLALFLLLAAAGAVGAADAPRYTVRTFAPPFEPARVNNRGVVLANSRDRAGGRRAALVDGDKVTVLPTLGGAHAVATGFNDRNEVVGHSQMAGPDLAYFVYREGVMREFRPGLDALEGFAPNGLALPLNMNVVLKVSGRYAVGRDAATMVPVLLIDGAEMYALDDLAGDDWRAVEGISVNQSGQIVARACKAASGHCEAVLLTPV